MRLLNLFFFIFQRKILLQIYLFVGCMCARNKPYHGKEIHELCSVLRIKLSVLVCKEHCYIVINALL